MKLKFLMANDQKQLRMNQGHKFFKLRARDYGFCIGLGGR
jgi:hypothetical protein